MTDLFRNHMRFADSKKTEGLQIADICANMCFRFFHKTKYRPYRLIRHRLVHRNDHREYTLLKLDKDQLQTDAPEAHVHAFRFEDYYPGLEDIIVEQKVSSEGPYTEQVSLRARWDESGEHIECDRPDCWSRSGGRGTFDLRPEIRNALRRGTSTTEIKLECDGRTGKGKYAKPCPNSRRFCITIVKTSIKPKSTGSELAQSAGSR
jgi:hypothetical protein